ncbi:serine/threonine-protein phosphatase 4 regulatory subunit 1 isoform X2 [Scleropages formosus]|uniref:serine/threonine-protein phosphatase 4 regulatory subunit 1 isoform X2 n=1 Tax=Scleropages formosus TaxID=113540 RepID=UPI0010FACA95|nr:serine/threonine-protein phosphatase 4 regulatory subunit 1 isoform X2 [Scleropages formosus]
MADLSLLQEDSQEDTDGSLDLVSQDELLSPLARLDKYAASENVFNRQMVARSLLDTLKAVSEDEGDCFAVLERVSRLADDSEPTVRAELMEQIPHIAIFCQEHRPSVPSAFSKYLLPIVVRYLADQNNQVRKTSQAALLVLLEQDLIERADVESQICPVLVDLTAPDSNDDVKTEAMAIICKMAPMVGKDITERLFLPRFCEMCCDCRMFHVRKVCAANFGDMCSVVGGEATEELLLPRFFQLCSDNVWGVRKACAECFMTVSSATSQEVRRTKLSSLFISLISDPSRWVRQAAFQSLGQFISTFASPSNVGQCFREEQVEDYRCPYRPSRKEAQLCTETAAPEAAVNDAAKSASSSCEELLLQDSCSRAPEQRQEEEEGSVDLGVEGGGEQVAEALTSDVSCDSEAASESSRNPGDHCCSTSAAAVAEVPDAGPFEEQVLPPLLRCAPQEGTVLEQELYNSFHYWRTPIPAIDLDVELQGDKAPAEHCSGSPGSSAAPVLGRKELEELIENLEPHIDDPDVKAQVDVLTAALRATELDCHVPGSALELQDAERGQSNCFAVHNQPLIGDSSDTQNCESVRHRQDEDSDLGDNNLSPEEKSKQQDVVPQALLDQYLSMTDPSRAQTVDMEIAKHCAYSLPGVALTLGRQNWHCLRDTYETLASDMQWKVRRTLAFSIHELALILGDQLTAADLVPIFNSFLKDLDEVRIGVLKHLYDFLKLLHQETRRKYLYQLQEFLVTDNSRNWRFRSELAEQLVLLLELYSAQDVYDYLRPLAFSLCTDRVSSVRWISYKLVSEMVRKLSSNTALVTEFLVELVDKFCHSPKWSGRQAFAFVCQLVVEDDCLSLEQFSKHLLGPLLQLASDPVPNVRVLLAKTLRQSLLEREYFVHSGNSHQEALEQTLVALQTDLDKDVKYFASVHPGSTRISEDALSTASSTY